MQKLCRTGFDRRQSCHADPDNKKRSMESWDLQATLKSACEAIKTAFEQHINLYSGLQSVHNDER